MEFSCKGFGTREIDVDQCTTTLKNFSACELVYSEYICVHISQFISTKRNVLVFGPKVDAEIADYLLMFLVSVFHQKTFVVNTIGCFTFIERTSARLNL